MLTVRHDHRIANDAAAVRAAAAVRPERRPEPVDICVS